MSDQDRRAQAEREKVLGYQKDARDGLKNTNEKRVAEIEKAFDARHRKERDAIERDRQTIAQASPLRSVFFRVSGQSKAEKLAALQQQDDALDRQLQSELQPEIEHYEGELAKQAEADRIELINLEHYIDREIYGRETDLRGREDPSPERGGHGDEDGGRER